MSAFSDLLASLDHPPFAPVDGGALYAYMIDEAAGATNLENVGQLKSVAGGGVVPNMVPNGAVTLGFSEPTPLIAGHTSGRQLKDTHFAARADSALLDRPAGPAGDPSKHTLFGYFELEKLKGKHGATSGGYVLTQKGGKTQLMLRGSSVQAAVEGQGTNLIMPLDSIAAAGRYFLFSSFDASIGWELWLNGIPILTRTFGSPAANPVWNVSPGTLDIGGSSGFESGVWGKLGAAGILYSYSLAHTSVGRTAMRNLFRLSFGLSDEFGIVFPWPTEIVPARAPGERESLHIEQDYGSTKTCYLGFDGDDAVVGSRRKLMPFVGEWDAPPGYDGAVSSILAEPLGHGRLLIDERLAA